MAEKKDEATAAVPAGTDVELTEAGQVAQAAAEARPKRKSATEPAAGKGHATRKRDEGGDSEHKRTTPVQFVREVVAELKKVIWPSLEQLRQYFVVVLVFVLIMIAYVFALDLGFGAAILKWLG